MEAIIIKLVEHSPVIAAAVAVIWFIGKKLFEVNDKVHQANHERIKALETHAKTCEEDRAQLHASHTQLQADVIERLSDALMKKD